MIAAGIYKTLQGKWEYPHSMLKGGFFLPFSLSFALWRIIFLIFHSKNNIWSRSLRSLDVVTCYMILLVFFAKCWLPLRDVLDNLVVVLTIAKEMFT